MKKIFSETSFFIFSRIAGGILFGFTAFYFSEQSFRILGLHFTSPGYTILFIIAGIVITYWFTRKFLITNAVNIANYPQIRLPKWSKTLFILNKISWAIYLTGYELLIRGLLFYYPVFVLNIPLYIVFPLNILFYALAHLPKGKMETLGSVPVGIIMGLSVIFLKNIYFPVIVHWFMGWFNEGLSFKANNFKIIK
ncbi:MAG: hypothetical protein D6707_05245 [Bacteroidetes bacterium]|nr:MAG: hypothetical protein D6707_05245 [Bacteroidota bacterium]